jgi:alpha-tubulin suppressor-like RCC1 family protein
VFACGYNLYGGLGINSTLSRSTYVQVTGISNAVAVAAGASDALALRADGLVFAVGRNSFGGLGINSTAHQSTYVQVTGI